MLYLFEALLTGFSGVDATSAELAFTAVLNDVPGMLLWSVFGLAIAGAIVFSGVQQGIERAVKVLMPTLFGLLVLLAIYNVFAGGFEEAVAYLFTADFSKVNGGMILAAIGQAFFSIGVAMAGMMTFGAYLPKNVSIGGSVLIIIVADTMVALVAGLVIFPAVFNYGLDPAGGAGLIFQTLPVAFAQMPGGHIVGVLFFLLLSVAAITSMVGLIEPLVSWLEEHRGIARPSGTLMVVSATAAMSVISVLSYNVWAGVSVFGVDLNTALDFLPNQIMLPLGGLLIAIFAGWFVSKGTAKEELALGSEALFEVWHWLIRYLVPLAVLVILVVGIVG